MFEIHRECYDTLKWCADNDKYVGVALFAFVLASLVLLSPLYLVLAPIGYVITAVLPGGDSDE